MLLLKAQGFLKKNPSESDPPIDKKEMLKLICELTFKNERERGMADELNTAIANSLKLTHELHAYQEKLKTQNEGLLLSKTAVEDAAKKYAELFNFSPTGYFTLSREGIIVDINLVGSDMLGKESSLLKNSMFSSFVSKDTEPEFCNFIDKVFTGNTVEICDVTLSSTDNSPVFVNLSGVVNKKGKHCLVNMVDITRRKQFEETIANDKRRLFDILKGTNAGTWEWNIQSGETIFNERWAEIIGYTLDEISPVSIDTWMKFTHPDDLKKSGELLEKHFKGDLDYYECEARMKHKNGDWVWVSDRGRVREWSEDGKPLMMFGTHTDITSRKRDEELIIYQANLLNNVSDAIIATDMHYNIQYWNKTAEKQYGWTADEVLGQPMEKFITNDYLGLSLDIILQKISKDGYWKGEITQNSRDGKHIPVISSLSIIKTEANHLSGYVSVNHDISEIKQAVGHLHLYGEILKNMAEGVVLIRAADGKIVYTNPKFERMFGYDLNELIGKHINIVNAPSEICPDNKEWEIIQNLSVNGVWQGEVQNVEKDGTLCWSLVNISSFEQPQYGHVWISIYQNITDLKQADEALMKSIWKYRTTIDASPDGILLIDLKGTIIEVSEIGLYLLGVKTRDELLGKDILNFVPDNEHNLFREMLIRTTNEGFTQNIGLTVKKKNRSLFAGEISTSLMQNHEGVLISFMIIIRDISHRKKMEAKQINTDRLMIIGEMAAGIAHEINQPLNIISLVMDNILFEITKPEMADFGFLKTKSDKIFENITRIRNIIDHVRAFSSSHEEHMLTVFNINSSIVNATSMIMEQFKYLNIDINLQLEQQISSIVGDTHQFEQVILNLLANAKDAVTEKRSKLTDDFEMHVGIKSWLENQNIFVEITDNGIGIGKDDILHVMLPFYTTKEEGKGTGLGLSICNQIMKEMGGTIEINSESLLGTNIKLILPVQKAI